MSSAWLPLPPRTEVTLTESGEATGAFVFQWEENDHRERRMVSSKMYKCVLVAERTREEIERDQMESKSNEA